MHQSANQATINRSNISRLIMSEKNGPPRNDKEEMILLRRYVAISAIILMALNTACTMSCVYLVGFGVMKLSPTLIHYLMAPTIAPGAAVYLLIARSMFQVTGKNVVAIDR